jgi:hypothetical protein
VVNFGTDLAIKYSGTINNMPSDPIPERKDARMFAKQAESTEVIMPPSPSEPAELPVIVTPPPSAAELPTAPANMEPSPSELERLRDILYGGQARVTDKRLAELEMHLETIRRDLADTSNEKISALAETSSAQLAAVRKELTERLDKQAMDQSAHLRTVQQTLGICIQDIV